MENKEYIPEEYWSEVANRINTREENNVIAGDDEPFYRYKRKEFLKLLNEVNIEEKSVLEVGSGPGGNLKYLSQKGKNPNSLHGADISSKMIELASKNLDKNISLHHFNGANLPFNDDELDIVFTATVLQHNTNQQMLENIIKDICRVSGDSVYIFERIEKTSKGDDLCKGRTIDEYKNLFANYGFDLKSTKFINIQFSYLVCGAIRKVLNPKTRVEGEPLNSFSVFLENVTLPVTKILDKIFPVNRDLCRLHFIKSSKN